jgi:hypothetical protein
MRQNNSGARPGRFSALTCRAERSRGNILGVTFTLIFTDGAGNVLDQDGLPDVAFREVYYDPSFSGANDGVDDDDIDVESVAAHD